MNVEEILPISSAQQHSLVIAGIVRLTSSVLANLSRLFRLENWARRFGDAKYIVSAEKCASLRALETEQPHPLFQDWYAEALAGENVMQSMRGKNPSARLSIRTKYFDDFVERSLSSFEPIQLVLLGAGMDMRSYRLESITPLVSCYEVDIGEVIDMKKSRLAAIQPAPRLRAASITRIGSSLTSNQWVEELLQAGFDSEEVRTIWVLEGIVYYFSDDEVKQLFRRIHELSSPGSVFCASVLKQPPRNKRGPAFRSCIADPEVFLQECGFILMAADFCGGPAANYGRWEGGRQGGTYYLSGIKPDM